MIRFLTFHNTCRRELHTVSCNCTTSFGMYMQKGKSTRLESFIKQNNSHSNIAQLIELQPRDTDALTTLSVIMFLVFKFIYLFSNL